MSAVEYAEHQRAVRWMEDREAARLSVPVKIARTFLARELGLSPGTLEDIRKGRLKGLRSRVERAIDAGFAKLLQSEIGRLNHELAVANSRGVATDRGPLAKAVATRAALDDLINEMPAPSAE